MVQRNQRAAFGTAHAFPGGVVEDADADVASRCAGITATEANRLLELSAGGLAYYSAAIRELFEETGILLADPSLAGSDLDAARDALNAGALTWDRFVSGSGLTLRCDSLHYFAFWITPEGMPRRFSTRFFLTVLPPGQTAAHCGGELVDSCWMPARAVLGASKAGQIKLIYPTRKTLESIAQFDAVGPLLAWARDCALRGVVCDRPTLLPGMPG